VVSGPNEKIGEDVKNIMLLGKKLVVVFPAYKAGQNLQQNNDVFPKENVVAKLEVGGG